MTTYEAPQRYSWPAGAHVVLNWTHHFNGQLGRLPVVYWTSVSVLADNSSLNVVALLPFIGQFASLARVRWVSLAVHEVSLPMRSAWQPTSWRNDRSVTTNRATIAAQTIFQHRINRCWATCVPLSEARRPRLSGARWIATPRSNVTRPPIWQQDGQWPLDNWMRHRSATIQSVSQSVRRTERFVSEECVAEERTNVDQPACKMDCQCNVVKDDDHDDDARRSRSIWRRPERTIRYVTLLQLDVNRYVRPTALLDDVINMCVSAHEIMTLLRRMQLSTRVLHSTIMSTVYDTVNRLWFLQCVLCTVSEPVSGLLTKPIGYSAVIEHPWSGGLFKFSVDSVCLSVCMSDYNFRRRFIFAHPVCLQVRVKKYVRIRW